MDIAQSSTIRKLADHVGIVGSVSCTAHCLLMPALLVSGSSIPAILRNEEFFHWVLLSVVIPCAFIAFFMGCRRHRDHWVFVCGGAGLVGLVLVGISGHDLLGHFWERILMIGASCLLVSAHIRNYWLCRKAQ